MAALMVVLFHLKVYTLPVVLGNDAPVWAGLSMGYAGVEIFFVLSGFIMVFVHGGEFGQADRVGAFLRKRVVRIYPLLWIMLGMTILLRVATGGEFPSPRAAVSAFLLLPDFSEPVIEVAWSLSFEMMFYLVFALMILNLRLGAVVCGVWFLASAVASLSGYQGWGHGFLLAAYNMLFLFGIVAALGYQRLGPAALPALVAGALVFFTAGQLEAHHVIVWDTSWRTLVYGVGATGIVAGLAALDSAGRVRTPRFLTFLGDASYSIYLVHIMAMTVAARVLKAIGLADMPVAVSALALFVAAVLAGAIVHLLVERPMMLYLRKRRQSASAAHA